MITASRKKGMTEEWVNGNAKGIQCFFPGSSTIHIAWRNGNAHRRHEELIELWPKCRGYLRWGIIPGIYERTGLQWYGDHTVPPSSVDGAPSTGK